MAGDTVDAGMDWERPILVGCCPSSGSTLLSVILDTHPLLCSGPELGLFSHPFLWTDRGERWRERLLRYTEPTTNVLALPEWSLKEGICPWIGFCELPNFAWYGCDVAGLRARLPEWHDIHALIDFFFRRPLQEAGKTIWVEKSPTNIYAMRSFLEAYPHGRGVVMIRDGRDVVCSLMKRGYAFAHAASIWVLEAALTLALSKHPRVHLIRYEDLVGESRRALTRLMGFLNLDAELDKLLDYQNSRRARTDASIRLSTWKTSPQQAISTGSVGRWRDELSAFHAYVLENVQLKEGFPGLEDMAGQTGRDVLITGGYPPVDTRELDMRRFADWLLQEQSTLQSLADQTTFHFQHASFFGGAGDVWPLVPCVAQLVQEANQQTAALEDLKQELANMRRNLDRVTIEMHRRAGVRYGVKESVRCLWQAVRRRSAG